MKVRHLIALAVLALATNRAYACLFATSTPPEGWYQWSSMLFAADVVDIARDGQKAADTITARVIETFKGPQAAGTGTLSVSVSNRYWTNCKVEKPAVGARVLVAMNANSEALLVPLSASFAERLRAYRIRGQGNN
jgi:hypothetical protein